MQTPPFAVALACAFFLSTSADARPRHQLQGMASYYSKGQRTASGERFNRNGFTAAHRTLPFGTLVRIVNRRNGRSVSVRINDRGPFRRGRVIDVSRAAASQLGMIRSGVVPVRLEIGLTAKELRRAFASLGRVTRNRREVMRSGALGARDHVALPRPVTGASSAGASDDEVTARMREVIQQMIRHEDAASVAMVEAYPPQARSLFADMVQEVTSPIRAGGNILQQFFESLVRPIGNCRAFETVDPITKRVVTDVARELRARAEAFSCYRDPAHNRRVGGARFSLHMKRKALDVRFIGADGKPIPPQRVARTARRHALMRNRGGIGTYCGPGVHIDSGNKRNWNWGCGKRRTRFAHRRQHRG